MKMLRGEITYEAATAIRARFPVLKPQTRGVMFEIPSGDHGLQAPDLTSIQDRLGPSPRGQLWKVEINEGGAAASACRFDNHLGVCDIGRQRLFEKHWFSKVEGILRNRRLEIRRHRDCDHRHVNLLDQCPPIPQSARNIRGASKLGRSFRISSRQGNDFAAWIIAECRDKYSSTVVAPDDANPDHARFSTTARFSLLLFAAEAVMARLMCLASICAFTT